MKVNKLRIENTTIANNSLLELSRNTINTRKKLKVVSEEKNPNFDQVLEKAIKEQNFNKENTKKDGFKGR